METENTKKTLTLKDLARLKGDAAQSQSSLVSEDAVQQDIITKVETLTPEKRAKVDDIKENINLMDSQVALQYGVGAQRSIASFSETILSHVQNKDTGHVGELLSDLVLNVKDLEIDKVNEDKGILNLIPGFSSLKKRLERFTTKYQNVEVQIDKIEGKLDTARMTMLKDITLFDTLYQKNLEYFEELQLFILAGEEKIAELRNETIPSLRAEAIASGEPMDAQLVNDFEETVTRFEKKVHDLKLSKTIAIQTAPQIKLIQNNDKLLVDKIQTAILNTIPLWKSQIVIALGLVKQQNALELQRKVTDTTNELLMKNSEMLKTNTLEIAKESERGIVEIETLKKVNNDLITTLEETMKIQREGREQRIRAEQELIAMEGQLKQALMATTR